MANTTIALRSSGVTGNVPSLGVIENGELSLNYADGIIYYKTASNTLGSIRTTQPAGLTTEVQFNDSGSFGANSNFTFNKTLATLNVKNTNVSTNLVATNISASYIITGSGVGGIIAGANVIYSNTFVANTGGITTTGNSSLNGIVTINYNAGATSSQNVAIEMYGANTKGGTGYFDFIAANNISGGATNKNKWFRIDSNGQLQIINSAYTTNIFNLNDSGYLTVPGGIATSQYIQFSDGTRQYTANAGAGGGGAVTSVAGATGAVSNNQILAGLQTVSSTNNITFDYVATANNGFGENFKVGDDAWIGDTNLANTIRIKGQQNSANAYIMFGPNDGKLLGRANTGPLTYDGNTIWHAGNDGVGSGLDADLLDGFSYTAFANAVFANTDYTTISATAAVYGNATHVPVLTLTANGRVSAVTNTAISFPVTSIGGQTGEVSNNQILAGILTVDGAGSGLDADLLDGLNSTSFANAAFANTDYTTISATAGVYGNASFHPVVTLTANGRVSSITNTAIAISADAITSGTLAVARGGTGVTTSTGTGAVVLNTSPTLSNVSVDVIIFPDGTTQNTASAGGGGSSTYNTSIFFTKANGTTANMTLRVADTQLTSALNSVYVPFTKADGTTEQLFVSV
jgi:hypothetical protein